MKSVRPRRLRGGGDEIDPVLLGAALAPPIGGDTASGVAQSSVAIVGALLSAGAALMGKARGKVGGPSARLQV